jgi:hypothetical protein
LLGIALTLLIMGYRKPLKAFRNLEGLSHSYSKSWGFAHSLHSIPKFSSSSKTGS